VRRIGRCWLRVRIVLNTGFMALFSRLLVTKVGLIFASGWMF
jgi:hypothetical protein